jgi:hypothetical protein
MDISKKYFILSLIFNILFYLIVIVLDFSLRSGFNLICEHMLFGEPVMFSVFMLVITWFVPLFIIALLLFGLTYVLSESQKNKFVIYSLIMNLITITAWIALLIPFNI